MIVQDLYDHITHALHGSLADLAPLTLVNEAGEYLFNMHHWKFTERSPSVPLSQRAKITVAAGTWTESSLTLTEAGTFANYDWLEGDTIYITGGTGATAGQYRIASTDGSGDIVLETSIGSGADAQTDITGDTKYGLAAVALPSDFGQFIKPNTTDSLIGSLRLRTLSEVLSRRTDALNDAALDFWGAIGHAAPTTAGVPTPRLELWPAPTTNDADAFTLFYRAKWVNLSAETDVVPIMPYCDTLMRLMCRAWAQGYEEDDQGSLGQRLAQIEAGPIFNAAKKRDGGIQRFYGPIRGGHAYAGDLSPLWTNAGTIGGPS
jgi:hypothetical protein